MKPANQQTPPPKNPLLFIIDLQTGWRHKLATEGAMLRTVRLARDFKGERIHCCFRNDPKSLFHTELHWTRFVGSPDIDLIPEMEPLNIPIYWRSTYDCLTPEVLEIVKQHDRVYMTGVFTDISVFVTALDIFDHNVPVSIITDCVATLHGEKVHRSALHSFGMALGNDNLVTSAEFRKLFV